MAAAVENAPPSEDGEAMGKNGQTRLPGAEKHWFAVYTTCRHEKQVARRLEEREIEHFLPTYRAQRRWKDGSRVTLDLPLFPGYVFVRICGSTRVRVLEVPGVVSLIGTALCPVPLPDLEIDTLRAGLDPLRVEPHPLLTVGQRVRIKIGALAGIEGIVIRKKGGFRLVLTLDLLMQSIAIEVNGDDVESAYTLSPLTLEIKDKEEELQRATLYEFKCLDSYPESQVLLSTANVVRR